MYPGGNALNFSVYAQKTGAQSAYLGVFGDDVAARHLQETLRHLKIDIQRCRHYQGENGYACIDLIAGDRTFIESNKGGVLRQHPLVFEQDDLDYIASFDLIHTSLNSYIEGELVKLKSLGVPLSFDFSVRGTDAYFRQICPQVDYGFISCGHLSETETLDKIHRLFVYGCGAVIATRGPAGAIYYGGGDTIMYKPEYIKPLDTLGAGDSFLTGFLLDIIKYRQARPKLLLAMLPKEIILAALERGNTLAALTLQCYGAFGFGKAIS